MIWVWTLFIGFVLLMLALDLGVFHRHAHVVAVREALVWSAVWVLLSLGFAVLVHFAYDGRWLGLGSAVDAVNGLANDGQSATIKYLTSYIVEKSLSLDNVFVIALLFESFGVPAIYQHRVLFWGILGALLMRGVMIAAGAALVARFHWVLYIFGVFLILTALKMLVLKSKQADPGQNAVIRLARRLFPVTARFHGEHFVVRSGSRASCESEMPGTTSVPDKVVQSVPPGTLMLTPLALALIMVETSDLIFALDSIPAIFAITADPFLVFTSNVFAILGLRSLYFALAAMLNRFRHLKVSLAIILMLVGVKMLAADWLKHEAGRNFNFYLLGVVLLILAGGIGASWVGAGHEERRLANK